MLARSAAAVLTVLLASTLVFFLLRSVDGNPASVLGGMQASAASIANIRTSLGLDDPLPQQYLNWLGGLAQGNLGLSWFTGEPVSLLLFSRFASTFVLATLAFIIGSLLALVLAMFTAPRAQSKKISVARDSAFVFGALPEFFIGILLIWIFALNLGWLPALGQGSPRHLVLPLLTLLAVRIPVLWRILHGDLLKESRQPWVRSLWLLGIPPRRIWSRHILPNALYSSSNLAALQFSYLLGGAVIVEELFSLSGMGKLLISAILQRDYPVIQGAVLVSSVLFVLVRQVLSAFHEKVAPHAGNRSHGQ